MGRFEFLPGVEKGGFPVYRQAHSRSVHKQMFDTLLYR